ncbi:MAG: bifunctional adenosylcobinamide kinase/adenosylcobinamide-phosphate guanylyltransferase [Treponema sp.]|nr:bifunctional adenosylcobinamide kinase/adenosylcobinamide-phosphate guanylyltransferase [Treponema sp.]
MIIFVSGGAASGKSCFAESCAVSLASRKSAPLIYAATLNPASGGDTEKRIKAHRAMRAGKGFTTVEWQGVTVFPAVHPDSVVLLEDVGNLTANLLYSEDGAVFKESEPLAAVERVVTAVRTVLSRAGDVVVVSNEIQLAGPLPPGTEFYGDVLAMVNRTLSAMSDCVYTVVAGIPVLLAGRAD